MGLLIKLGLLTLMLFIVFCPDYIGDSPEGLQEKLKSICFPGIFKICVAHWKYVLRYSYGFLRQSNFGVIGYIKTLSGLFSGRYQIVVFMLDCA